MYNDSPRKLRKLLPLYLACYALWLGLSALGLWLLFQAREAMFVVAVRLRFNPWVLRAIDQFGTVTLGLIFLVGLLALEHYLRQGVVKNRLWARATRVFLFVAAALGLCYGVQFLLG